jgi:hypothetical protein
LTSLLPAVEAACSAADLASTFSTLLHILAPAIPNSSTAAETFAKNLCLAAGVTISIPGAGATSAPPATSAAPSTSAAAPTTTSPAPVSSAPATGVSTVYVTVPCTTSVSGSAVPTKGTNLTATATKSATPSVFTGAASAAYVGGATMFGGLMAALAMLL